MPIIQSVSYNSRSYNQDYYKVYYSANRRRIEKFSSTNVGMS